MKKEVPTMRALLVALLLMFGSPARADDAELKLCGCSGRVVSIMQCIGSGSAGNSMRFIINLTASLYKFTAI